MTNDTIVALSSGSLPSGVAVVRVSGPKCHEICSNVLSVEALQKRMAQLCTFVDPVSREPIDTGLVIRFESPHSFTGEDCLEFHAHGGKAVVEKLVSVISSFESVRFAEAGEFSRRAFENGKIDLTTAEGIADLISSETEAQRRLAVGHASGNARDLYDGWRDRLVRIMAMFAAEIDFVEEDDIPDEISHTVLDDISELLDDVSLHLDDKNTGEIIRDGFKVAIVGEPNVGKSSLLNALAKRDVAIVTDIAGTTRDVLQVNLDIGGYYVTVSDTAGIRGTEDVVEKEGIRRALAAASAADLVVRLVDSAASYDSEIGFGDSELVLVSKDDAGVGPLGKTISTKTGFGVNELLVYIQSAIEAKLDVSNDVLISRFRHREALVACAECLQRCLSQKEIELLVEELRSAATYLGKITGRVDIEDLLDVIFSEFCVGK